MLRFSVVVGVLLSVCVCVAAASHSQPRAVPLVVCWVLFCFFLSSAQLYAKGRLINGFGRLSADPVVSLFSSGSHFVTMLERERKGEREMSRDIAKLCAFCTPNRALSHETWLRFLCSLFRSLNCRNRPVSAV